MTATKRSSRSGRLCRPVRLASGLLIAVAASVPVVAQGPPPPSGPPAGPPPTVTSISVTSGNQGQSLTNVEIIGTEFQFGDSQVSLGTGVTIDDIEYVSPEKMIVDFTIGANAPGGKHDVTVSNPDGTSGKLEKGFTVIGPPPTLSGITPDSSGNNGVVNVTVTGTGFVEVAELKITKTAIVGGNPDTRTVEAAGETVNSGTSISASFDLSGVPSTHLGAWNLFLTNGDDQTATLNNSFTVTGPPAKLAITQQPTSTTAGQTLSTIAVTIQDSVGQKVSSATHFVTLTITSGPAGAELSGTSTVAASNGVASFTTLSIRKAGNGFRLTAAASGLTSAVTNAFNVSPDVAAQLAFTTQPATIQAGATFSAITITVQDQWGNTATNATHSISLGIGTNPVGATLLGTTTRNAVNSVATFNDLAIQKTGAGYTLTASATGLTTGISNSFDITPAPAAQVAFLVQPSTTAAGSPITPAVQVQIQDQYGNLQPAATTTVNMTLIANPPRGRLSGITAAIPTSGVATFSDLSVDLAGSGYSLIAQAAGLASATSDGFTVTNTVAVKLAFTVQPSNTTAGQAIAPAVQVTVQDEFGNLVSGAANAITIGLAAGPAGATLEGATTVSASGGTASFAALVLKKAGQGFSLSATADGLSSATSVSFTVSPAAAASLSFTVQPSNTTAGATISPAPSVAVLDTYGNTVTSSTATITLAIGANPGGATLFGTVAVAAVSGVATFTTLSLDKAGNDYTLAAAADGLTGATSSPFTIIADAGAISRLAFTGQPGTVQAGVAMSPPVQLAVQDQFGNTVPSATNKVTVALQSNPTGTSLAGATSVDAVNGVATFTGLKLNVTGAGYTLIATATGLPGVVSQTFDVIAGTPAAAQSSLAADPSNAIADGQSTITLTILLKDATGNPVPSVAPADLLVTAAPSAGVSITQPAAATNPDGRATATVTTTSPGTVTFTVRPLGLTLSATVIFTANPVSGLTVNLPAGLHFVGLPTAPLDPTPPAVLGGGQWRLARFDPVTSAFVEYPAPSRAPVSFNFAPGVGLWLRLNAAVQLDVQGVATPNAPFTLPLAKGWSNVANPFDGVLSWDAAQLRVLVNGTDLGALSDSSTWSAVSPVAWIYDAATARHKLVCGLSLPGFETALKSIPRLSGFWANALVDNVALRLPAPGASGRAAPAAAPGDWAIGLEAGGGQVVVGVSTRVGRGLEVPAPPLADDGQTALTLLDETGARSAISLRGTGPEQVWQLLAASPEPGEVVLRWPSLLRQLPRGVVVELTDQTTGRTIVLNTRGSYQYTATRGEARRFRLRAGPGRVERSVIGALSAVTTRGGGAIQLTLTGPADLTVTVRGLGGRELRVLRARAETAGMVAVAWDGRDAEGRALPRGTYVLEAAALSPDGAVNRAVRTVTLR